MRRSSKISSVTISPAAEIAEFIIAQLVAGEKQADIARKLGKPRDWVSRFAAIPKMPSFSTSEAPEFARFAQSMNSIRLGARSRKRSNRFARRRTASPMRKRGASRTSCVSRLFTPASRRPTISRTRLRPTRDQANCSANSAERAHESLSVRAVSANNARGKPTLSILVRHRDREGRLLIDGPANKGTRFASVRFFETGQTEEVPVSELRIEEIAPC